MFMARRAAAATRASPNGGVGMLSRSVFGDTNSTRTPSSYLGHEAMSSGQYLVILDLPWEATGKVTQKVPDDFPTAERVSTRP